MLLRRGLYGIQAGVVCTLRHLELRRWSRCIAICSFFPTSRLECMRRFRGKRSAHLVALVAGLLLVAYAEEAPGPQFATDPRPTRSPTEAAASASPALLPTAVMVATPASLTDLLSTRGAVSTVFMAPGDDVWSISSDGEAIRLFEAPAGSAIRAIDPSPSAQQVAVLLETRSGDRQTSEVVILDLAGEIVAQVADLGAIPATPTPGSDDSSETIDWSPQGDRILVSFQSNALVEIDIGEDREPVVLNVDADSGAIVAPAWSPTGESIAFIAEREDERTLQILDTNDGAVSAVVTPPEGRLVVDFAWMPDGVSLLFTEGGEPGSATTGIDLWRVDASGENRELVASAGTVAPVARIATLSPSPDGRSVAYAVLVPGSGGPLVDSVWVRDHASGLGFRVPLSSVASVEDIWWTDQGLIFSIITTGTAQSRPPTEALLQLKPDGSMVALWAAPAAAGTPSSGTPAATPVAP